MLKVAFAFAGVVLVGCGGSADPSKGDDTVERREDSGTDAGADPVTGDSGPVSADGSTSTDAADGATTDATDSATAADGADVPCAVGSKRCVGTGPQTCTIGGWGPLPACAMGCTDGECTGECIPGGLACVISTAAYCNDQGHQVASSPHLACDPKCTFPGGHWVGLYESEAAMGVSDTDGGARPTLVFQRGHGQAMPFAQADLYCANLLTGGYPDWRLPTLAEDMAIGNLPATCAPRIDNIAFPDSPMDHPYWVSDASTISGTGVALDYQPAKVVKPALTDFAYVRCVRSTN